MSIDSSKGENDELSVLVSSSVTDAQSEGNNAESVKAKEGKNKLFQSIKIFSWFWLVAIITLTPVMMDYSHYSSAARGKVQHKYMPPSVLTLHFASSIVIGSVLSYFLYGFSGLRDCFRIKPILMQAPVSVGYALSEILALSAMRGVNPIMYAVIHKIRLIITALCTRFILRRRVTPLMWIACFCVTSNVMAFVLFDIHAKSGSGDNSNYIIAIALLFVNILVSVLCSVGADYVYKLLDYPLTVQMAQGRVTASLGALFVYIVYVSYHGFWSYGLLGGPDGGWDLRVLALFSFMIVRDWTTCFVLLHLDAVWKALAGSVAVATTYLADILVKGTKVVPSKICLLLGIIFTVGLYTVARIEGTELKALQEELARMKSNEENKENAAMAT